MNGEWCGPGGKHLLTAVYHRPWWAPWRKITEIRCWECDLIISPGGVAN